MNEAGQPTAPLHEVPIDWEALEDAFENNAPEVHSYLHLTTGEVLRVVDGVADPQMHSRISGDASYLRIDPVSSREQYRWMERFIPLVEDPALQSRLAQAIDGKGAFRRFKDVLASFSKEREQWFTFRSERLRTFIEAWLHAHAIQAAARPSWAEGPPSVEEPAPESVASVGAVAEADGSKSAGVKRHRSAEALRQILVEIGELLGPRDLDLLVNFAEFLKARRAARGFARHHEHARDSAAEALAVPSKQDPSP